MKCENCGAEVSESEVSCINCGIKQDIIKSGEGDEKEEYNIEYMNEVSETIDLNAQNNPINTQHLKKSETIMIKIAQKMKSYNIKHRIVATQKKINKYVIENFNNSRKRSFRIIGIVVIIASAIIFINSSLSEKLKLDFYGGTSMENRLNNYVEANYKNTKKEQLTIKAIDIIAMHDFKNGKDYLDKLFYDKSNNGLNIKNDILKSYNKYKIKLGPSKDICSVYYDDVDFKTISKDDVITAIKLFPPEEIESNFLEQINSLYRNSEVVEAYNLTKDYSDNNLGTIDKINEIKPDIDVLSRYYFVYASNVDVENKVKDMMLKYDENSIDNECIDLIKEQYIKPDIYNSKAIVDKYLENIGDRDKFKKITDLLKIVIDDNSKISTLQGDNSSIDTQINDLNQQISDIKDQINDANAETKDLKKAVKDAQDTYNEVNSNVVNLRFYCLGVFGDGSDDQMYEVALPAYIYDTEVPSEKHAILNTTDFTFTSKGWANKQVVKDGTTEVTLKSDAGGFKQIWDVYKQFAESDRQILKDFQNNISDGNSKIQENNKTINDLNKTISNIVNGQMKQFNSQKSTTSTQVSKLTDGITFNNNQIKEILK